jgi:hypothetical protein
MLVELVFDPLNKGGGCPEVGRYMSLYAYANVSAFK